MSAEGGARAVFAALLANLGIAAAKFLGWFLTRSSSMLAEAIHSVADSGNQILLILGRSRAGRKATPEHPFGYGRERYIYAFLVSVVLFSLGGLFALYEAYQKYRHPHGIHSWQWVPVTVLIVAIVLEGLSFRTAVHESNQIRGRQSWRNFIVRAKAPELPVVLLEDSGALIGLVFALFGVSMTLVTGDGRWDALGSALIGILLVIIATVLATETRSLLLGEAASLENVAKIERAITDGHPAGHLIQMRTLHLGPEDLLVAAKIAVQPGREVEDVNRDIDAIEERIRAAVPIARVIYLKPEVSRSEERSEQSGSEPSGGVDEREGRG